MFLCHQKDIPLNQWRVYPQLREWAVVNNESTGIELISNVCQHQGSYLSGGRGEGDRICPYHGWRYRLSGEPVSSGNTQCANSKPLPKNVSHKFFDFILSEPIDANIDELGEFVNTGHLQLIETRIDIVRANWRNIVDLFLDVEHIPVIHPGVYQEISAPNVSQLKWTYGKNSNIQLVPRVEVDNEFNSTLQDSDRRAQWSAAWITLYPYTMMEYQPGAWFITVCIPTSNKETSVVVYKYRDVRYSDLNWKINERVWELAWRQDRTQAEMMSPWKPPIEHFEEQKQHFRMWCDNHPWV